jgi:hypothetical protein
MRRRTWGVTAVVVEHRRRSSNVRHGAAGQISAGRRREDLSVGSGEVVGAGGGRGGRRSWRGRRPAQLTGAGASEEDWRSAHPAMRARQRAAGGRKEIRIR